MYDRLISGVTNILEERAIQTGFPTCDTTASSILKRLKDEGVLQLLRTNSSTVNADSHLIGGSGDEAIDVNVQDDEDKTPCYPIHSWGGNIHIFPIGVTLPTGTPEQAWVFWCCGDSSKKLPPFRLMRPVDLNTVNQRIRLSDVKFLMKQVEATAKELDISVVKLTFPGAVAVFQQCKAAIELPPETLNNRKRRRGQLVWPSVATILRQKKTRVANESSVSTQ
ncbi:hypothetical protein PHMEG_00038456 [Phytophthora megakarya]|uniref:Uncharacterized protein n=1 Tax=Phytophthora megakarya TaxID=4795 RepID=A0A225UHU0_9STRA|nr:hypothetical protein PHMEG_00038456 [Phytophthora megakarya]